MWLNGAGWRGILSALIDTPPDCHTRLALQRGAPPRYAFQSSNIQDCNIIIRSSTGWKASINKFTLLLRNLICNYRIVASLVRKEPLQFLFNIIRWLLVAIPATWTNSWLSYIQNKLAIAYRTRLTQEVMKQYLGDEKEGPDGKVYYKLCMYFPLW